MSDSRFKTLFDRNARLIHDGTQLQMELETSLGDLMRKFMAKGYSPREIGSVMNEAVHNAINYAVLGLPFAPLSSGKIKT